MLEYRMSILIIFYSITIYSLEAQVSIDSLIRKEVPNSVKEFLSPNHVDLTVDESIKIEDLSPAFAPYKDNFFITGIPLNRRISNSSADALFQVSIRQRLTKTVLPFNTFAYLTYTQKSFWQIYAESSPFRDINYNPGIGLAKLFISNGHLLGSGAIQIMHESNGKEGEDSRSWNFLSLTGKYFLNSWINLQAEAWVPYIDGGNNRDLLHYKGLGQINVNCIDNAQKWWFELQLNPRKGFGNINTAISLSYKISNSLNQYLFLRFQDGYADSLLDYDTYSINFRIGICIKPNFYNIY